MEDSELARKLMTAVTAIRLQSETAHPQLKLPENTRLLGSVLAAYLSGVSQTVTFLQACDGEVTVGQLERALNLLSESIGFKRVPIDPVLVDQPGEPPTQPS